MNKCFQKVPPKEPSRDIYTRLGAFSFGGTPMEEKKAKRKLTAILSADVKGYSRLMQDDEEATVRTITVYRGVMSSNLPQSEFQSKRFIDNGSISIEIESL
jgi:class 3 adenylate cyclase